MCRAISDCSSSAETTAATPRAVKLPAVTVTVYSAGRAPASSSSPSDARRGRGRSHGDLIAAAAGERLTAT